MSTVHFTCKYYALSYSDHDYVSRDEDRGIPHSVRDTRTIGSAYDRYLQSAVQILYYSLMYFYVLSLLRLFRQ